MNRSPLNTTGARRARMRPPWRNSANPTQNRAAQTSALAAGGAQPMTGYLIGSSGPRTTPSPDVGDQTRTVLGEVHVRVSKSVDHGALLASQSGDEPDQDQKER